MYRMYIFFRKCLLSVINNVKFWITLCWIKDDEFTIQSVVIIKHNRVKFPWMYFAVVSHTVLIYTGKTVKLASRLRNVCTSKADANKEHVPVDVFAAGLRI